MEYKYNIPLSFTAQDNNSYIGKKTYRIFPNDTPVGDDTVWSCTKCSMDYEYCNPIEVGDKLYFQIVTPKRGKEIGSSSFEFISIVNGADDTISEVMQSYLTFNTYTDDYYSYWNIQVNVNEELKNLVDCFYLRYIKVKYTSEQYTQIMNCYNAGVKNDYHLMLCALTYGTKTAEKYTEPYCFVECNQETLLIEGVFTKYDCNGNYYGGANPYKMQLRIKGELEEVGYSIEESLTNNFIRKSVRKYTNYTLRGHEKVPLYVAQKLGDIMSSQKILINGLEYIGLADLTKNNDIGKMFIINASLKDYCDIDFSCGQGAPLGSGSGTPTGGGGGGGGIDCDSLAECDVITTIQGDITTIKGDIQGDITTRQGDITTIQGDITNLQTAVTLKVTNITSSATPSIYYDVDQYNITALATNITSVSLSGTFVDRQRLIVTIKDNGTARTITWGSSFNGTWATLPTTTVVGKTWIGGFIYNATTSKYECVASFFSL